MGGNASEWSFASGTPWAISAMGGTSDWWVPNPENDRMVVANTAPVMMAKPRHAISYSDIVCVGRWNFFIKTSRCIWVLKRLPPRHLTLWGRTSHGWGAPLLGVGCLHLAAHGAAWGASSRQGSR